MMLHSLSSGTNTESSGTNTESSGTNTESSGTNTDLPLGFRRLRPPVAETQDWGSVATGFSRERSQRETISPHEFWLTTLAETMGKTASIPSYPRSETSKKEEAGPALDLDEVSLKGPARADPALTNTVRRLLDQARAIVISKAWAATFPIQKTEIRVSRDSEEDTTEIRLWVHTKATLSQTFAFWDSLDQPLSDWIEGLQSSHEKGLARHAIRLFFTWKTAGDLK